MGQFKFHYHIHFPLREAKLEMLEESEVKEVGHQQNKIDVTAAQNCIVAKVYLQSWRFSLAENIFGLY